LPPDDTGLRHTESNRAAGGMSDPLIIAAIKQKLHGFRAAATVLRHAANLMHDAKGFIEQAKADTWFPEQIFECEEKLRNGILPEVDAMVGKLEAELRP
jgi:hypothetical protein